MEEKATQYITHLRMPAVADSVTNEYTSDQVDEFDKLDTRFT
jgi:hypothetical protein